MSDAHTVAAADAENDVVWLVDIDQPVPVARGIPLQLGEQVGRLAQDAEGRLHVVLRATGQVADLDLSSLSVIARRSVCPEPRGLTYDPARDALLVACAGGELVTLPAAGGAPTAEQTVPSDARDVVLSGGRTVVTTFRSAELTWLASDGSRESSRVPAFTREPFPTTGTTTHLEPAVAWHAIAHPNGVLVAHQYAQVEAIPLDAGVVSFDGGLGGPGGGGYGGSAVGCLSGSVVMSAVTLMSNDGSAKMVPLHGALPLDVAFKPESPTQVSVVLAGRDQLEHVTLGGPDGGCSTFGTSTAPFPVAVTYARGQPVVQVRNPAGVLVNATQRVVFPAAAVPRREGLELFHREQPAGVACASCHPEALEDGRAWDFIPGGKRRTQNLTGGLLSTAPFHWDGTLHDLDHLMADIFVGRMGGLRPTPDVVSDVGQWLNALPAPKGRASADVSRGRVLFASAGCATCHSGPLLTDNLGHDVGTGGVFQTPSLVGVRARAPYLHDGCAKTLEERFGPCGGDLHGNTQLLNAEGIAAVVAYLESL